MTPDKELEHAAATFRSRNAEYGAQYKMLAPMIAALFPEGFPTLDPEHDYNRLGVFLPILTKLMRYCRNWKDGHPDSLTDLAAYAMMLQELDAEMKAKRGK